MVTIKTMTAMAKRALRWIAAVIAIAAALPAAASTITYYHNDIAGSPVAATNAARQVIWRESYRPYGERLTKSASAKSNDVWFTSRREDSSGLVYMGARHYDPVAGRFVSTDPKGFDEANVMSFGRYTYANDNPYRYVDPNGKESIAIRAQERAQIGFLRGTVSREELDGLYRAQAGGAALGLGLALAGSTTLGMMTETAAVETEAPTAFRIIDGVRRAKAAEVSGRTTIAAEIEGGGGKVSDVSIDALRSPKEVVETGDATSAMRWERALRESRENSAAPIRVRPGSSGTPIKDVKVEGGE